MDQEQQKQNRMALADHLEKNVTNDQYNHDAFKDERGAMCALGHAASIELGGIYNPSAPKHAVSNWPQDVASHVFGEGSYDAIFSSLDKNLKMCLKSRQEVIDLLRNF